MNPVKRILVPADGGAMDEAAMEFACQYIKKSKAEVFALYVVEVDRELALNAPLDAETAKGELILDSLTRIGNKYGGRVHAEMLQARASGPAIVGEALNRQVDMIVMGMTLRKKFGESQVGERELHVLKNAPCQVWIVRAPLETNGLEPPNKP